MWLRRGLRLEYATLAWNVVGSVLVLAAAVAAHSVALAGFGLDSLIEIVASAVVVWQLRGTGKHRARNRPPADRSMRSLLLALYVAAPIALRPRDRSQATPLTPSGSPGWQ